jgi:methionyl-tRNA formyltransferase
MDRPRVIFFGTGEIALPAFRKILEIGPRPCALVTQPDRPVGRHQTPVPPAIKTLALEAGLPVFQPERLRDPGALDPIAALDPDLIVVMAYGQILPRALLAMPKTACINLHASLLPLHRGAACIQAALDAGDTETGVTVMHVAPALDTGDIILAKRTRIGPDDTGGTLHDRLADLAADALAEALPMILAGAAPRTPQDSSVSTYAPKLERDHGRIDWSLPATILERRIRAYDPWPGTFTLWDEAGKQRRLKILAPISSVMENGEPGTIAAGPGLVVHCGEGALLLHRVQPDGGRPMGGDEFLRGRNILITRFQ